MSSCSSAGLIDLRYWCLKAQSDERELVPTDPSLCGPSGLAVQFFCSSRSSVGPTRPAAPSDTVRAPRSRYNPGVLSLGFLPRSGYALRID
jgi:hypothetical protein